jgi:hypothetical protein
MIKPQQMREPVYHHAFHLPRERVSGFASLPNADGQANHKLAKQRNLPATVLNIRKKIELGGPRKAEHVGGPVLTAKLAIQKTHLINITKADIDGGRPFT